MSMALAVVFDTTVSRKRRQVLLQETVWREKGIEEIGEVGIEEIGEVRIEEIGEVGD